jgi:hypothetical protein
MTGPYWGSTMWRNKTAEHSYRRGLVTVNKFWTRLEANHSVEILRRRTRENEARRRRELWIDTREIAMKADYHITGEQFGLMILEQEGLCKLCHLPLGTDIVIEHDHVADVVRGITHQDCNHMIGFYETSTKSSLYPEILKYLSCPMHRGSM